MSCRPCCSAATHDGAAEPRRIVVSTVISGSRWSMCRVTLPVRAGVERSLLCLQVPEKSGFGGEQIPDGAESAAESKTRNISFHICSLLSLKIQPQRQLDFAWRSRAYRAYRIYDGRVQVNRVDDAAEPRALDGLNVAFGRPNCG